MFHYRIHITSKNYNAHCLVTVLANSEDEAKEMAGESFREIMQGFMNGPIRHPNPKPTIIKKEVLLSGATYKIEVTSTPTVLTSEWDMLK